MATEIPLGRGRAMTAEEIAEFLTDSPLFAFVSTLQEDGSPYVNPVWFEWRGDSFVIITKPLAKLCQNLRRDPRATLAVASPAPPYRRVLAQGRAEEIAEDWIPTAERMVRRYVGPEGLSYLHATGQLERVAFAIRVEKTTSWNGGGLDRCFFQPAVWHEASPGAPAPGNDA